MSVSKAVGWKPGETPTVLAGLRVQAMATGLMHPRIVYALPNGDGVLELRTVFLDQAIQLLAARL